MMHMTFISIVNIWIYGFVKLSQVPNNTHERRVNDHPVHLAYTTTRFIIINIVITCY
jgi:hypothetical protein